MESVKDTIVKTINDTLGLFYDNRRPSLWIYRRKKGCKAIGGRRRIP